MAYVIRRRRTPTVPSVIAFLAVGVAIYAALYTAAEWLVVRNGHMNPVYKVETAGPSYDWVILGASHAMPLDFDDADAEIEIATGQKILNLAGPGTGPLYNRFVLEHFLTTRRTRGVLYVVDSFAFRSPSWNEGRLSDAGLLAHTPFNLELVTRLATYVRRENVDGRALLDYVTGFSKLNDRERFETDQWEGEAQFDRVFRPSAAADRKRIDYLYPPVDDATAHQERYFSTLAELVKAARATGAAVTLAKFPLPKRFRELLPHEADFDKRLVQFATELSLPLNDFSSAIEDKEFYADTDHLNRAGVRKLLEDRLQRSPQTTDITLDQADLDVFERRLSEVQRAFADEDHAALRRLSTPEMVSYFSEELADNARRGVRNEVSGVRLLQADIAEAWNEREEDYATAAFRYEAVDVLRDRATGALAGGVEEPTETVELWTFVRKAGGEWTLSAIQEADA